MRHILYDHLLNVKICSNLLTYCNVTVYRTTPYVFKNTEHAANLFKLKELGNIYSRIVSFVFSPQFINHNVLLCAVSLYKTITGCALTTPLTLIYNIYKDEPYKSRS